MEFYASVQKNPSFGAKTLIYTRKSTKKKKYSKKHRFEEYP
jgi:hypothetical protein